jgi:hypothetical protein
MAFDPGAERINTHYRRKPEAKENKKLVMPAPVSLCAMLHVNRLGQLFYGYSLKINFVTNEDVTLCVPRGL